ncbi:MAG TPA: alkaline phosphatase family protein, partial [Polyangiaceae bacterium]|nr:alkaline phosphatase family protein [Polyangiaceae bacterium]
GPAGPAGAAGVLPDGAPIPADLASTYTTATPIKHLVIIFGENISFDHYFATYPGAVDAGAVGGQPFTPVADTPKANNLVTPLDPTHGFAASDAGNLLTDNPSLTAPGNVDAGVEANPFLLTQSQAATADMNHGYNAEQLASDNGAMDLFPLYTGSPDTPAQLALGQPDAAATQGAVMAYFDGTTLGTLWSYAQNYALNDNAWTSTFGPSTPGAINLVSGQTNGLGAALPSFASLVTGGYAVPDGTDAGYTLIDDVDPLGDVCAGSTQGSFSGKNIGDLLNAKGISWGWFHGGFDLTVVNSNGTTGCNRTSTATVKAIGTVNKVDYIPHHEPFQYYASTANLAHLRPSSVTAIGHTLEDDGTTTDPANHQYDSHDFFDALQAGNFPAVNYLKAPGFQEGHPGYSDPVDEQVFVAQVVEAVQASGDWATTAIVITYDDSDGWYDHQAPPIVNPSSVAGTDALNGPGECSHGAQQGDGGTPTTMLLGTAGAPVQGRCGYGTRIPLLLLSPFAKKNYVDHTLVDQTSTLRFIEDNWLSSQRVQDGGSFDTIAGTLENMLSL